MTCEQYWKEDANLTAAQNYVGEDDIISTIVHKESIKPGEEFKLDLSQIGHVHFTRAKVSASDLRFQVREVDYSGYVGATMKVTVIRGMEKLKFT